MAFKKLDRRTILKGAGASIGLPLLEAMLPARYAHAQTTPQRFCAIYFPCGTYGRKNNNLANRKNEADPFDPTGTELNYNLPEVLSALQPHRNNLIHPINLQAQVTLDSPQAINVHGWGSGGWLTSSRVHHTQNPRNGTSIDQIIADQIGNETPVKSLVITNPRKTYQNTATAAFTNNISWRNGNFVSSLEDPRDVFNRLFSGSNPNNNQPDPALERRRFFKQSILDSVIESVNRLNRSLGASDQQKLDQYLTSVREVEVEINREPTGGGGAPACTNVVAPGANLSHSQWIDAQLRLIVLGFQCDSTRVATIMLDQESSFRYINFIPGILGQHHILSHHMERNSTNELKIINEWYIAKFKDYLDQMNDAGLMRDSLTLFGTPFSNGNNHNTINIPTVLAGQAGGTLQTGRMIRRTPDDRTPFANLHLSILRTMGVNTNSFGNSTGTLF